MRAHQQWSNLPPEAPLVPHAAPGGCFPIPLKKSVFEWSRWAEVGAVAAADERLPPHAGKTDDGMGISLASLRRL